MMQSPVVTIAKMLVGPGLLWHCAYKCFQGSRGQKIVYGCAADILIFVVNFQIKMYSLKTKKFFSHESPIEIRNRYLQNVSLKLYRCINLLSNILSKQYRGSSYNEFLEQPKHLTTLWSFKETGVWQQHRNAQLKHIGLLCWGGGSVANACTAASSRTGNFLAAKWQIEQ